MRKKRILLFCHDGSGLGHLRRISRLAGVLQDDFASLVLSGMREASWIVPSSCGLMKIPAWDGLHWFRAEQAGRGSWLNLGASEAAKFRSDLIASIGRVYSPDVIIVDYLPFGQRRELDQLFASSSAIKYFLHRGISDTSDSSALRGPATESIAAAYDRIIVASDMRLVDVAAEDIYCWAAREKVVYAGFIGPARTSSDACRSPIVVCSGGGGRGAEALMLACIEVATRNPRIPFKVVIGPRSSLSESQLSRPANCEIYGRREDLPELHQASAVTVTTGGYNSVVEAISGGARLIVHPSQTGDDDERLRFADKVGAYYPVTRLERLEGLENAVLTAWHEAAWHGPESSPFLMDGAYRVRDIINCDLLYRS